MFHNAYEREAQDDGVFLRAQERRAFDRAVGLLQAARDTGPGSPETNEAVSFMQRLWTLLIEDLANRDNALPETLRASLISIGIFALRQGEALRLGQSEDFDAVIDLNAMMRESLA